MRGGAVSVLDSGQLVRVLFGDLESYPKLRDEVASGLGSDWSRTDVAYYVAGRRNAELLRRLGAQRIRLVEEREYVERDKYGQWYTKPFLLRHAIEECGEMLALDFDCREVRSPDPEMWKIIRSKKGPHGGTFLAPNVGYLRPVCLEIHRRRGIHPIRRCLNTCAVYCSDASWLDSWLIAFRTIRQLGKDLSRRNDETPLSFALDSRVGILDSHAMVEAFELPIVRLSRSIPEAVLTKSEQQLYFTHR